MLAQLAGTAEQNQQLLDQLDNCSAQWKKVQTARDAVAVCNSVVLAAEASFESVKQLSAATVKAVEDGRYCLAICYIAACQLSICNLHSFFRPAHNLYSSFLLANAIVSRTVDSAATGNLHIAELPHSQLSTCHCVSHCQLLLCLVFHAALSHTVIPRPVSSHTASSCHYKLSHCSPDTTQRKRRR